MNILDSSKKRPGVLIVTLMLVICLLAGTLVACTIKSKNKDNTETTSTTTAETHSTIDNTGSTQTKTEEQSQNTVDTTETEDTGYYTPTGTAGVLQIFLLNGSSDQYTISTVEQLGEYADKYTKYCEYPCTTSEASSLCRQGPIFLIKDNGYFFFNCETGKVKDFQLPNGDYSDFNFVYEKDTGKLLGLSVRSNNKAAFYSFKTNSFVTDFSYGVIYSASQNDYLFADCSILSINTGEVLFSDDGVDNVNFEILSNDKYVYFLLNCGQNIATYNVYNENFELILGNNEKHYLQVGLQDNGCLTVIDDDEKTFICYNQKGEMISQSKTYPMVNLVVSNYVSVVDTDGYLKLIDTNENEVVKFVEWTDTMYFHWMLSGYYTKKSNYPEGIYLVVQDSSIDYNTPGNSKEYYYAPESGESGVILIDEIGGYAKPVLYLYPTEKTDITVTFDSPNLLTTTYPKYKDGWSVTASPDGSLYDKSGRYYYGLYWEEIGYQAVDFSTGFYVSKGNASEFLEEKLNILGFTQREANEFIMYWLPIIEKNGQSLIYFELTEDRQAYNKLNISPAPNSMLRVAIHVKKVDSYVSIKEQNLPTFHRSGFSAVEWGGVVYDN